jgi:hypothetical protein
MPAPRKYPDELRERAGRLVRDVVAEAGSLSTAGRRIGKQHPAEPDGLLIQHRSCPSTHPDLRKGADNSRSEAHALRAQGVLHHEAQPMDSS